MIRLRNIGVTVAVSGLLVAGGVGVTSASASPMARASGERTGVVQQVIASRAVAKPKPKEYKNCTKLNKVYPHGVGKKGAKDKVSGKTEPVTNFTVSKKTYKLNKKSDRDKDGIACEKL
jgi:hypothetical protein